MLAIGVDLVLALEDPLAKTFRPQGRKQPVGLSRKRAAKAGAGPIALAAAGQHFAQPDLGVDDVGLQVDRLLECCRGCREIALGSQGRAEIELGLPILRIDLERSAKAFDRLPELSLILYERRPD